MQEHISSLKDTIWLAERLGLSVSTIERLRARFSKDIPAHLTIGKSIRYDLATVEKWIADKMQLNNIQSEVSYVK
ncbi:MAG: helix-turn-helix domain-containing protein [Methylobacter sp.]|nr:helix-turn-helix domain-containing protein [Methylobacter sp.]